MEYLQVDVLHSLDSGIETSDENDTDEVINYDGKLLYSDSFNLCSSCTSSIPKVIIRIDKNPMVNTIRVLFMMN